MSLKFSELGQKIKKRLSTLVAKILPPQTAEVCPDAVPFLPDALEIKHQPLPWWGRWGIIWIVGFFFLAFLWSCLGKMDVFVTSTGRIISREPTIVMKPLERTVIKSIQVEVGESVKAGQVLMTFDPVFSQADVHKLNNEVKTLSTQFNRLRSEFNKQEFSVADDASEDELWQHSIFTMRQQFYAEKMKFFDEELARIEQTKASLEESLTKQMERLAAYQEIEAMLLRARSTQTASPRELKELQISRFQVEAEVVGMQGNILELGNELSVRRAERNAFIEEWRKNTAEEMVQIKRELVRASNEYDKALQLESYVTLQAPCDAIVHEIAAISIGSAIREAEPLVTLVPTGGDLEVEAEVAARDIGKVSVGDITRVKLMPFPFQQYGTMDGEVRNLSENTFQKQADQNPENDSANDSAYYYRARITLNAPKDGPLKSVRLIPGMEVQAEIKVGERRIITYIMHPLIKSFDESLREP